MYIIASQLVQFDDRTKPFHILTTMHCQNSLKSYRATAIFTRILRFEPWLTR